MKFFIDFEATQENEIVSVGCVADNGATFKSLIKPQFSCMTSYISRLTKITDEMLNEANSFDEVFSNLYAWMQCQEPTLANWEFFSYGTDADFVRASMPNAKSDAAIILSSVMMAKLQDSSKEVFKFFCGSISLIRAFNYVENVVREQKHDPLEDAIMLQKVVKFMDENEPLTEQPAAATKEKASTTYKSPSGIFYCRANGKNASERRFESCEDAMDWLITNVMRIKNPDKVNRNKIMGKIMKSIRCGSMYCNYKWRREKEKGE